MDVVATIGLEVHVQMGTQTKLFCGCRHEFGSPPNSLICPVCTGQPGVLPVLNQEALKLGIRAALALDCEIAPRTKFDRKNYFYPDLPKGYQISQYDMPYAVKGQITLLDGTQIRIHRIHMEEDAGKGIHDRGPFSLIDLNRAGVPLLECVSEPDLHTPEHAVEYLTILKETMEYCGISDCDMEKGSLRCDVNVSVAPAGADKLGTKVEVKNLNSFRHIAKALEYEIARQEAALAHGEEIVQETRLWREAEGITLPMRSKEEAHDYRYFPEPDLPAFEIGPEQIEAERSQLPELPATKRDRFRQELSLSDAEAVLLTQDRDLADFFEATAKSCGRAKSASNWVSGVVLEALNEEGIKIKALKISPAQLGEIINRVEKQEINVKSGRRVFAEVLKTGKDPAALIEELNLSQISDAGEIEKHCREAMQAIPKAVEQFRAGKEKAIDSLVGKVMGATRGRANPKLVQDTLRRLMKES